MLEGGKMLGTPLLGDSGLLNYGGQHLYYIIQYVNQFAC